MISCKETQARLTPAKTAILTVGAVGCGYLCSKGISKGFLSITQNGYKMDISLLNGHGYEELKKRIFIKHEENFWGAFGKHRNYPLLKYKENIDWYIGWLWVFRILNLFSKTGKELAETIKSLNLIRRYILADQTFINERRRFEERKEDQKIAAQNN